MGRTLLSVLALMLGCLTLRSEDSRPIVPAEARVLVRYLLRSRTSAAWSVSSATLRGAVSERMMASQLAMRHPGYEISILSAAPQGKTGARMTVRYQLRQLGSNGGWTTTTATLQDALTESMARAQLTQRHPRHDIRILSLGPAR